MDAIDNVNRIFETPLIGTYCGEYGSLKEKIRSLYDVGKGMNWNASTDIEWDLGLDSKNPYFASTDIGLDAIPEFRNLSSDDKEDFIKEYLSWQISQFMHGEQGALLIASQLVSCAPDMDSKLYASSQTFDEARHVEVFKQYMDTRGLTYYKPHHSLERLLDKILTDKRWDLKFIGMQLIIEGIALASLNNIKRVTCDPLLKSIIGYVLKDESRHVNFGVLYLQDHVAQLEQKAINERAKFCFDACVVMRDRLIAYDVFEKYGWETRTVISKMKDSPYALSFQDYLYRRLIPVFSKVGLITEEIQKLYKMINADSYIGLEPIF